jgi:hypothetical protein
MKLVSLVYLALSMVWVDAFAAVKSKQISTKDLPKFNKTTQRWEKTATAETGYPLYETLLRNGPVPFLTRLTNNDDYEQAVLKFQAAEKCSVNEAQGNMGTSSSFSECFVIFFFFFWLGDSVCSFLHVV